MTFIIYHVNSWATRLRVFSTTIIKLDEFAELREFMNLKEFVELEDFIKPESAELENSNELENCKSVQLYLDASEYLNDLFL